MNIVFVHLKEFPLYVKKNLKYTSETFSNRPIHLLIDKSIQQKTKSFQTIRHIVNQANHEQYLEKLTQSLRHNKRFRNEFWYLTIVRLLHFFDYVIQQNLRDALLVESDVILLPNFPFEKFTTWNVQCAYPLATLDEGVASVLYCKDADSATKLKQKLLEYQDLNPMATDCSYLGFLNRTQIGDFKIGILPTVPTGYFARENHEQTVLEENFQFFGGVFDASTLGLYFLGIDLRNTGGIPILRKSQDHYPLKSVDFSLKSISELGVVTLNCNDMVFPIFNFHLHTKYPAFFSSPIFGSELYRALTTTTFTFSKRFLFCRFLLATSHRMRVKLGKE